MRVRTGALRARVLQRGARTGGRVGAGERRGSAALRQRAAGLRAARRGRQRAACDQHHALPHATRVTTPGETPGASCDRSSSSSWLLLAVR
jgi:hypothetical protein